MEKLIFTRQGAAAYVAAPLCVFLLLVTLMQFAMADPFDTDTFTGWQPMIVVLMAVMAFALSVLPLLTRWFVLRLTSGRLGAPRGVSGAEQGHL